MSVCVNIQCLKQYQEQLKSLEEWDEAYQQAMLSGMDKDEFQCPLCKSLCNSLMPVYCLSSLK